MDFLKLLHIQVNQVHLQQHHQMLQQLHFLEELVLELDLLVDLRERRVLKHGVPEDATSELASSATTFFSQSDEAKMASCLHQGYGKGGFPAWGIPPNGGLFFEIEVLSIKGKSAEL